MNKLIAVALAGIVFVTPAQAGNEDVIVGAIVGAILGKVLSDSHGHQPQYYPQHSPQVQLPQHNPRNSPRLPGYSRGVNNPSAVCSSTAQHSGNWVIVRQYNCYGELLGVQKSVRHY